MSFKKKEIQIPCSPSPVLWQPSFPHVWFCDNDISIDTVPTFFITQNPRLFPFLYFPLTFENIFFQYMLPFFCEYLKLTLTRKKIAVRRTVI